MKHIHIAAFAALALSLAACGQNNPPQQGAQVGWGDTDSVQVCMDKNTGQRIPDNQCQQANYNGGSNISPFVWYYLGMQAAIPAYYQPVPLSYGFYRPVYGYHYHVIGPQYYSLHDRGSLYRSNSVVVRNYYHYSGPVRPAYTPAPAVRPFGTATISRPAYGPPQRPSAYAPSFKPAASTYTRPSSSYFGSSSLSRGSSYGSSSSYSSRSSFSSSSRRH